MNLLLLYLLVVLILFVISVSSSLDIQVQVNLEENNNNNQNPNRTPIKPSPELPAHLIDESYNHVRLHPHHLAEAEMYTPPNVHPLLPLDEIHGDRNVMEEFDEMWLTQEGKTVTHAEIDSAIEAGAIEIDHQNNTLKTPAFSMEIPQLYQMYCKRFHKFYANQHLAKRISHFKENLLKIVRHNAVAPDDDARLGQTRTLDMGDDEFKETHAGSRVPAELRSRWGAAAREHHRAEREGSELNEIIIPPPKEEQKPSPSPSPVSDTDTSPTVAKRNTQRNQDISPVSQCNTVGGYCTTNQKCVSTNGTPITGKCFSKDPNVKCCVPRLLTPVTFLDDFDAPRPHAPFPSIYTSSGPYKNWVEEGVVNPIRNQEDCGACYSFAAIAALESHYAIVTGKLYEFSEQQAVDCSKKFGNLGCIGGWYGQVFDYIIAKENKDNHCHGVSVRKFYPYANKVGTCHEKRAIQHDSPAYITGYEYLPERNITAIMKALDQAPLTSALYSLCPEFRFYTSGIIQDLTEECTGQQVDHAVNIVGYGTENDIDYWLIRNSWDQTFGLDGYAKIERGRDVLGIESHIAVLNIDFDA